SKKDGPSISAKDNRLVHFEEDGEPFLFTSKPYDKRETFSLDEVRELDTPEKAAMAYFCAMATKDEKLLDDAVNQLEYSRDIIKNSEKLKSLTDEQKEEHAKKSAETLVQDLIAATDGSTDETRPSEEEIRNATLLFCCKEFYVVKKVGDVWVITISDEGKEFVPVKDYVVILNKDTKKYEVAAAHFLSNDDKEEDSGKDAPEK
ncbi:hypothetical protein OAU50_07480, partial [Planctomycetota bacterium]|nr:hypothetical protein [Planctomycetota bacterium]